MSASFELASHQPPQEFLIALFQAAIAASQPQLRLGALLPAPPKGRTIIIGAGKAAAAMARAFEDHAAQGGWPSPYSGCVVTRDGYEEACRTLTILSARHPVPDIRSLGAAEAMFACVDGLGADDLVLALVSGGGSALMVAPQPPLTLADKQAINAQLLACGASISEMNCVRAHMSAIKGGHLARRASPARVVTILISDVPGDDPAIIASGPTVGDATRCADALDIIRRYKLALPEAALAGLRSGAFETVKPDDPCFAKNAVLFLATPQMALEAAATAARQAGLQTLILSDRIEGEAREVAKVLAAMVWQIKNHHQPAAAPVLLLCGGETTVTKRGNGVGGRNVEFLLALALELRGLDGVYALAGDTDGVDGAAEIAGAYITPNTLEEARACGLSPRASLDNNDAHSFFGKLGASIITGPTRTNVNDFRAILVMGDGQP